MQEYVQRMREEQHKSDRLPVVTTLHGQRPLIYSRFRGKSEPQRWLASVVESALIFHPHVLQTIDFVNGQPARPFAANVERMRRACRSVSKITIQVALQVWAPRGFCMRINYVLVVHLERVAVRFCLSGVMPVALDSKLLRGRRIISRSPVQMKRLSGNLSSSTSLFCPSVK